MSSTTDLQPQSTPAGEVKGKATRLGRQHGAEFVSELESHAPWEVWAERLADRKRPLALPKLVGQSNDPLEWSLHDVVEQPTTDLLQQLGKIKRHWHQYEPADWSAVARDWLTEAESRPATLPLALECLAWTHSLSRMAVRLPAETWWDLFAFLLNTAVEASNSMGADIDEPADAVVSQLMAGELPLTLAYWFPRVESCAELAREARHAISTGIVELLDGEGMLHSRYVHVWRALLACWTRSVYLAKHVPNGRLKKTARLQYEWFVRQSIRCRRTDGSLLFEEQAGPAGHGDDLLRAALKVGGDRVDREVFECAVGNKNAADSRFQLPVGGEHSEWSESAILRTGWSPHSAYLGMTFNPSAFAMELGVSDAVIWSGEDLPEIRVDNEPLQIASEWDVLCWTADEDVDYIELEASLSRNWSLQRQILLARNDGFLLMADTVVGGGSGNIQYRRKLPIRDSIHLKSLEETTEVGIMSRRMLGWMMPLALCEWKVDRTAGEFDGVSLQQQATGKSLYAPLFVDLDTSRKRKSRTWRQLAVGSQLELVPSDTAVAYRVQIGKRQWIIYRSLGPKANRTFIGQNVTHEFVVARFQRDGSVDELIQVE